MLEGAQAFTPFLQLIVAAALGMMLGIERVLAGRTAGPRTYGLVSLGGCLLTILSLNASVLYRVESRADPAAIVAAIVTGIGFLGAGLIIFRG
ncbi:MgtC/SapB family protein, partial [Candidatus Parcubacteria bacterium]|nr:MgtC/SapB family protein [Candidatus Parcubacteria bacterium]